MVYYNLSAHSWTLRQVSSAILNDVISHNMTKPNSQNSRKMSYFIQLSVWLCLGLGAKASAATELNKPYTISKLQNPMKCHHYLYIVKEILSRKCATPALVWPVTWWGVVRNTCQ